MPKQSTFPAVQALSSDVVVALRGYTGPNTGTDVLIPASTIALLTAGFMLNITAAPYNADPTGTKDSTAAYTAAGTTGKLIYAPAGSYLVNSTAAAIPIAGGGIVGDGAGQTFIYDTATNGNNTFNYTGSQGGRFENITCLPLTSKSGGYAIQVTGTGSGEVSAMRFSQMIVEDYPNCLYFERASLWSVIGCNFYSYTGNGILVDNQNNADSGDSVIMGCQLIGGGTSSNGIQQVASGGLKVIGNKFNNNGVGFLLALGLNSTSDLLISGNSIENSHFAGIQLQRSSGSAIFANVNISANQFLVASSSGVSNGIFTNNGSDFLFNVTVAGNTIEATDSGASTAITLDYVTNGLVDGNTITGGGGSSNGVTLGTHNVNVKYGVNTLTGFGTDVSIDPTANQAVPSDLQSGTISVTCSTALGATGLFQGSTTITFPKAYSSGYNMNLGDCEVAMTSLASSGGGVAASPLSVSQTQLFLQVIADSNGAAVPVRWTVRGVM